jgi:Family of unknown function (DUF6527)
MIKLPIRWVEVLAHVGIIRRPAFLGIDVPESPDAHELRNGIIFREVRDGYPKWAHLVCPRCGEHIQISLAGRPSWKMDTDWLRRPTLHPSTWQTGSCEAHFFVRGGEIQWCLERQRP